MSTPRCYVLLAVFLLGAWVCAAPTMENAAPPAQEETRSAEIDQELALFRDHLLNNKDFATRVSAATVLLFKEAPAARELVIEALTQSDNATARAAVCKALDASRTDPRQLKNAEDFLLPLIGVLRTSEDGNIATLAAEATLMFSYDQVQSELEKIVDDGQLPATIRSNAVYALQLHPDKRAALKLISLLDSPDGTLGQAAKNALTSLGISVGQDAEGRRQAISELQQQGPEAYLRKRLVRSEADIRELRAELGSWQQYYFASLRDRYDSFGDEAARSDFLAERLKAGEPAIKLWALDRLEELKKGTGKPKLSDALKATLLDLVSNKNRQVRLKTAQLLALMWELNSAQRLLGQLGIETDAAVKQELFVALGGACYFASLPTSDVKVPDEVRKQTLEWAVRFLKEPVAVRARSGADVIRKLLEQDGLTPDEVDKYLKALAERYRQAEAGGGADQSLQGELLNAMAGLCAQRSVCRSQAIAMYSPLFEQALKKEADTVRQAAVEGFINIDKAAALKRAKKDLANDRSASIRAKLVDLAGEVGTPEDLDWLAKKIGLAGESEPAWQAMLKIFRRSGVDVMRQWMDPVKALPPEKLPAEQKLSFLAMVEQKAQAENKAALLKDARKALAELHAANGSYKQAVQYLDMLEKETTDQAEKDGLMLDRLAVCLQWPNFELVGEIIQNYLLKRDLRADGPMVKSLDGFLKEPPAGADPNALLERLTEIKVPQPESRPVWRKLVQDWSKPVAKARKPDEVKQTNN